MLDNVVGIMAEDSPFRSKKSRELLPMNRLFMNCKFCVPNNFDSYDKKAQKGSTLFVYQEYHQIEF